MTDEKSYEWRIGEILIQNGWITWDQLEATLATQRKRRKMIGDVLVDQGLITSREGEGLQLGEILIKNGWMTWKSLSVALDMQRKTGRILGKILLENGFVTESNLYRGLAVQFKCPYVDFSKIEIPQTVLRLVPKEIAYTLSIVPLVKDKYELLIAVSDPLDVRPLEELKNVVADCKIRIALASPTEIGKALFRYYGPA